MTSAQELGRAHTAHREHGPDLMARDDVTGTGVGLRRRNGELTEERVLKVYVTHKRAADRLRPGAALPATLTSSQGEVSVDVEEMHPPTIPPLHPPTEAAPREHRRTAMARLRVPRRPAVGGASVAHWRFPVGTIALGVVDRQMGLHCILSCNHVLAQLDGARVGAPVLQPAPDDGGALPLSAIGTVLRWTPVRFGGAANVADAAIAACPAGVPIAYVDGIGPIRSISPPLEPGQILRKVGRTTGLTEGRVVTVNGNFKANYAMLSFGNTPALFVDQVAVDMPCAYGDSGSLVVDDQDRAAALLFAGTDRHHTWCTPFMTVATALDIDLLPAPA